MVAERSKIPIPTRVSVEGGSAGANGQDRDDREMDTIVGKDGEGTIVTLVGKKSGYMLMEKLDTGKQADPCGRYRCEATQGM